ncbi:MAG: hypothetical protein II772_06260 [Lachnospiraceae bacterium]|nr:hypothetical protein [Lachnospiraceae bacterium]
MNERNTCIDCPTRCDAAPRPRHDFEKDAEYAEAMELELAALLDANPGVCARKSPRHEMPDIEVSDRRTGEVICYVEVKALKRAFMGVERILPESGLTAPETVELNTSDLMRYDLIRRAVGKPVFVLWRISERPCLTAEGGYRCFFGGVGELMRIRARTADVRTYRRKTRAGDVVNGEHKGVVVNFHFSVAELTEARPENCLSEILAQVRRAGRQPGQAPGRSEAGRKGEARRKGESA